MPFRKQLLLVELNRRGESLLAQTLLRRFPRAEIHQSSNPVACLEIASSQNIDAVIVHLAVGMSGEDMVKSLRDAMPRVPILMISATDRRESAMAAGASEFLLYDEWLLVGQIIGRLLNAGSDSPWPTSHGIR